MEKEFVTYNQSLRLKKLGFNEPCFKGYTEEYKKLINFSNTHTNVSVQNTLPTKPFTAPLYQQAFRWFRDNYDFNQFIHPNSKSYFYTLFSKNDCPTLISDDYSTYEEAELACLEKLLEIVEGT